MDFPACRAISMTHLGVSTAGESSHSLPPSSQSAFEWTTLDVRVLGQYGVAFSIDGRYCYPSDGSVVDCIEGKKTSMKISPSEKLVEVESRGEQAVRNSGQMGGVYGPGV